MALLTLIPPATEPVTLTQVKLFARVDFTDDDTLWPTLISAAREYAESYCQRRFIQQTMRLFMDFFPGYIEYKLAGQKVSSPFVSGSNAVLVGIRYAVIMPYPTVQSIVQFLYQDQNGNPQTLIPTTNYVQDLASQPARLMPLFGQMWPVARVVANAVQVDYVTGWGMNLQASTNTSTAVLSSSSYQFLSTDVGRPISIPGAGASGATLNTTVASVASGVATLATQPSAVVNVALAAGGAYLGQTIPEAVQIAIMRLATAYYENRTTDVPTRTLQSIKQQLSPYRDVRL